MTQISLQHGSGILARSAARLSTQVRNGIKWWAEHQAWPAIDDIRIEDRNPAEKAQAERATYLRF